MDFITVINKSFEDFGSKVTFTLVGPFKKYSHLSNEYVEFVVRASDSNTNQSERFFYSTEIIEAEKSEISTFTLNFDPTANISRDLNIEIYTSIDKIVSFRLLIDTHSLDTDTGAVLAGLILVLLNVLIVSEVTNKFNLCKTTFSVDSCYYIFSIDCPSNISCSVGRIYFNRSASCITRSTNNE